jgi:hypothetical protein
MATLTNIAINARSMNGLITISDGAGTTIENGVVDTDSLITETMTSTNMISTNMIVPRVNTNLVAGLGSTVNLTTLCQNINFNNTTRYFEIWNDSGSGPLFSISTATAIINLLNCANIIFNASPVLFSSCPITFSSSSLSLPNSTVTSTLPINAPSIPVTINNWNFATPARPINTAQNQTAPYTAITGWTITAVVGTPFAVAINNGFATYINTYQTLYPDYPAVTQALSISQNTVPNTLRVQQSITFAETGAFQLTFWIWGMYNTYRVTQTITASINSFSQVFVGVEQLWTKCMLRFNISAVGSYPLVFDFINTFSNSALSMTSVKIEKQTGLIVSDGGLVNNQLINKSGLFTTAIENRGPLTNYGYLKNYGALGLFAPYSNGSVVIGTSSYGTVNSADGGAGSVFIGSSIAVASPNSPVTANYCIAIGMGALEQLTAANRLHAIGFRCLRYNSGSADNVAYGYSCGELLGYSGSNSNRNVCIGNYALNKPQSSSDNVSVGYQNMTTANFTTGTSFCVSVGSASMYSVASNHNTQVGYGSVQNMLNTASINNSFFGSTVCNSQSGAANVLANCTFLGAVSNVITAGTYRNSTALGCAAVINEGYEIVCGGDDATGGVISYPRLTLPEKNRINCCQFTGTSTTFTINWRTNEYVVVNSATCNQINLPQAISSNSNHVGAAFHICRTHLSTSNLIITAFGTEKINWKGSLHSSVSIDSWVMSISFVCVDYVAGNGVWTVFTYNDRVTLATDANKIQTLTDSTYVDYPVCFTTISTGGNYNNVYANSSLNYNPNTSLLTVPNLSISDKVQIESCQFPGGATINLSYNTNENVILQDATTTIINLPTPNPADNRNVGAKFYIIRAVTSTNDITINAPAGQTIGEAQEDGTLTAGGNYLFRKGESQITVVCIAKAGMTWMVMNTSVSQSTDNLFVSSTIPLPSLNYGLTFGGLSTSDYYPQFSDTTNLNYKPSTQTLTATNISCSGTINANFNGNINITDQTYTAATFYPTFVSGVGASTGLNGDSNLQYRPDTETLLLPSGIFQGYKSRATCFQYLSQNNLITSATTLTNPLLSYYPFTMKSAATYTITLPEVNVVNVGTQLVFKRIGGSLQSLGIGMSNNQPAFLLGNAVGSLANFQLVGAAQSCGTMVAIQSQDAGAGTFSNVAGSTTISILTQTSGTLSIGGKINLNGVDRFITAYSGGSFGGTGNYIVNSAVAAANTGQPYTSSITYGWSVTTVQ